MISNSINNDKFKSDTLNILGFGKSSAEKLSNHQVKLREKYGFEKNDKYLKELISKQSEKKKNRFNKLDLIFKKTL